jgi:dynamin 1-like protein
MEMNYLFTNDHEYLNNFTTFIPKQQNQLQINNSNSNNTNNGQNKDKDNINDFKPQSQLDATNIFIKEIRSRIEAYFKLIVSNLRDSIPKIMGNYLVKEIEENMQLKLYNKLYNAKEMTDLLSEPESVAERRKELNDMIKVMKNAQKIIRRDPDLMTVMQININDSDITSHATDNKKKEEKKEEKKVEKKESKPIQEKEKPKPVQPALKPPATGDKKKTYGNLFG